MEQKRKVEIKQPEGHWLPKKFEEIRKGNIFRVCEPDGTPVLNVTHNQTALSDAFQKDGVWTVEAAGILE